MTDSAESGNCPSCKRLTRDISKLRAEVEKLTQEENASNERQIHRSEVLIYNQDQGKKITLRATNTLCFWCCHQYDTLPYALPQSYFANTYYVTNHLFCSPNCALAYNVSLGGMAVIERKTLLKRMYREMHDLEMADTIDLREAGPKELLKCFGGVMSIEEYRAKFKQSKQFTIHCPPVRTIQFAVEERTMIEKATLAEDQGSKKSVGFLV